MITNNLSRYNRDLASLHRPSLLDCSGRLAHQIRGRGGPEAFERKIDVLQMEAQHHPNAAGEVGGRKVNVDPNRDRSTEGRLKRLEDKLDWSLKNLRQCRGRK